MQNTRLSRLVDRSLSRFGTFLRNPWRRLSVLIISLLVGNFFATLTSTVAGQNADLDVVVSMVLVLIAEVISWVVYRSDRRRLDPFVQRVLLLEMLNGFKLGTMYGLFVEAFKLGS
ncbi:MAG: DUF565 domain-containing protein [Elainella sp. Prado103]|jgi:hypothetical protein|nr:DUF565 domain-containing protein [Elainella sp. Prado103]